MVKVYEYPVVSAFGLCGSERYVLDEDAKTVWFVREPDNSDDAPEIMEMTLNDAELAQFRANGGETLNRSMADIWHENDDWDNLTQSQIDRKTDMFDNPEYWEMHSQLWVIRLWLCKTGTSVTRDYSPEHVRTVALLWEQYQKGLLTMQDVVNGILGELGITADTDISAL